MTCLLYHNPIIVVKLPSLKITLLNWQCHQGILQQRNHTKMHKADIDDRKDTLTSHTSTDEKLQIRLIFLLTFTQTYTLGVAQCHLGCSDTSFTHSLTHLIRRLSQAIQLMSNMKNLLTNYFTVYCSECSLYTAGQAAEI